MLLSAPPLEQRRLRAAEGAAHDETAGRRYWSSARTAAPPTSGPVRSQRLLKNRELTILSRPPRAKIAPPPPPSTVSPLALPSARVMFCTTSRGVAWSWQWTVVQI